MISFGWDTETTLITQDRPVGQLVCVSYALGDQSGVLSLGDGVSLVREILEDPGIELVGHNLPYDFQALLGEAPDLEPLIWGAYDDGRVYDTLVAAWLDDIARGCYQGSRKGAYTLAGLVARYLGEHLQKEDTWRLRYGELLGVPIEAWPQEAISYATLDAVSPLRLRDTIKTVGEGDAPDLRRQCAHHWWLALTANHGIATDPERVQALYSKILEESTELVRALVPLGWVSVDHKGIHRHPSVVQKYIKSQGYPIKQTKKGGVSIDAEACEMSGDPVLGKYARLSRLLDCINKDSEYLSRPFVRCSYGLAESGRSTSWGPNLQNLKTENY
jgi:DNA polymerase I-like protein with 3'-5' exonuclease and polymerase domains